MSELKYIEDEKDREAVEIELVEGDPVTLETLLEIAWRKCKECDERYDLLKERYADEREERNPRSYEEEVRLDQSDWQKEWDETLCLAAQEVESFEHLYCVVSNAIDHRNFLRWASQPVEDYQQERLKKFGYAGEMPETAGDALALLKRLEREAVRAAREAAREERRRAEREAIEQRRAGPVQDYQHERLKELGYTGELPKTMWEAKGLIKRLCRKKWKNAT